jgi:hypothetical protein
MTSKFHHAWPLATLFAVAALTPACSPPSSGKPPVNGSPDLASITWRRSDMHKDDALILRPDGTYSLNEHGIYGGPPGTPPSHDQIENTTGHWHAAWNSVLYLDKSNPKQPGWEGYVRVFRRGAACGFTTVASRDKLDGDDTPDHFVQIPDGHFLYFRDIAPFSDEADASATIGNAHVDLPNNTPADVLPQIKRSLPPGWTLTPFGNSLVVARDQLLTLTNGINIGPSDSDRFNATVDERYVLILRFAPSITPRHVEALQSANAALDTRLEQMQKNLRDIDQKFYSYVPDTPDQQRRVTEYEAVKATRQPVPQYYTATNAVFVSDSLGWGWSRPDPDIDRVKNSILALFEKF